jgi:hypothetical protein
LPTGAGRSARAGGMLSGRKDIVTTAVDMSQRLMGASLLVFKNKSDVAGSMTEAEIREVRLWHFAMSRARRNGRPQHTNHGETGITFRQHSHAQVADHDMQRDDGRKSSRRATMGRPGRQRPAVPILDRSTISVVAMSSPTAAETRCTRCPKLGVHKVQRALGLAVGRPSVPLSQ